MRRRRKVKVVTLEKRRSVKVRMEKVMDSASESGGSREEEYGGDKEDGGDKEGVSNEDISGEEGGESTKKWKFLVFLLKSTRFVERFTYKGEAAPWGDARYNKDQGIGPYIGDLCIFLGQNESFCLSASDYPGLNPNSGYFAAHGSGFGICDLASRTTTYLSHSTPPPGRTFWFSPTISQ